MVRLIIKVVESPVENTMLIDPQEKPLVKAQLITMVPTAKIIGMRLAMTQSIGISMATTTIVAIITWVVSWWS